MNQDFEKPSVFEYTDYRGYLKDFYRTAKEADRRHSFRYFAAKAGFRSPNFLQLVMEGKRNLTEESIASVAKALRLGSQDSTYFRNLVLLNQTSRPEERHRLMEQLLKSRKLRAIRPLREAQYRYYTRWYFVPIRELVGHKDFREDPRWIASHLIPAIEPAQAEEALKTLESLGLLTRDAPGGRLRQVDAAVSTDDEVLSEAIAQYHREAMRLAAASISAVPREQREISSCTVCVSEETARLIKARIQSFKKELLELAQASHPAERVYQINFQLFPLTTPNEEVKNV